MFRNIDVWRGREPNVSVGIHALLIPSGVPNTYTFLPFMP